MNRLFWLTLCCILPLCSSALAQDMEVKPVAGLTLKRLLIGEEVIDTGKHQLAEVTIFNQGAQAYRLRVRLVITLPNRNIITYGDKKIIAKPFSEVRALIPYPIEKHNGGDYTMAARVFNQQEDVVLATDKLQEQIFYGLDRSQRDAPPVKRRKKKLTIAEKKALATQKKAKLLKETAVVFDPPDLTFSQVRLTQSSVIRGETTHIQLFINNDGGNIASGVNYSLYWYFTQRPKRKVNFFRDQIRLIAPGERKIVEVPLTIPVDEQPGRYLVVAKLDEENIIKEMDDDNNDKISSGQLIFGDVGLVFPADTYSFAEDGLFQFEWRSQKYNQFKLQISSDPAFPDEDSFYLPKGDMWTPSFKINPMRGEMPAMGIGLMETKEVDHLYWRVVAKNSQGKVTKSQSRIFYITLKPKK